MGTWRRAARRFLASLLEGDWKRIAARIRRWGFLHLQADAPQPLRIDGTATFSLAPHASRAFTVNLPAGRYRIGIVHADAHVALTRRALVLLVSAPDRKDVADFAKEMGTNCSRHSAFQYMGSGRRTGLQWKQVADIALDRAAFGMVLTLENKADRYINIDGLRVGPGTAPVRSVGDPPVRAALDRLKILGARNLLYADIDLNVVDGSSVWLSSMASILGRTGPTILVVKRDVENDHVVSNIEKGADVTILSPSDLDLEEITGETAVQVLRRLDDLAPLASTLVLRGLDVASAVASDRQFKERLFAYLTDFYVHGRDGIEIPDAKAAQVDVLASQAAGFLIQTEALGETLRSVHAADVPTLPLPPPVLVSDAEPQVPADVVPVFAALEDVARSTVRIVYAGKIAPDWGIVELLDWTARLRARGVALDVTVVANKISGPGTPEARRAFRHRMEQLLGEAGVRRVHGTSREGVAAILRHADFAWCWRPPAFENVTRELSTKMVEAVANGHAAIAYPSPINRQVLGEDYPFFVTDEASLEGLLRADRKPLPAKVSEAVRANHDLGRIAARLAPTLAGPEPKESPGIVVAGHDLKFVAPYISNLKRRGHHVRTDRWEWGEMRDRAETEALAAEADVVLCEWGLANAVWYSNRPVVPPVNRGRRLVVRIHLQEINPMARKFGHRIDADRVDLFVFVSERVRDEAVRMFGWPAEKTQVIPNFVLDREYVWSPCGGSGPGRTPIRLGMVGIIPQRKRLDRAVDVLEALLARDVPARLVVKGPRPETLDFMHAPGRKAELNYYQEVYDRIDADPALKVAVTFEPWGNDVAAFYRRTDVILSPSDFESFHYALADGVLSGCLPVVWNWEEAAKIYTADWIVSDADGAVERILSWWTATQDERDAASKAARDLVVSRYGFDVVRAQLDEALGLAGAEGGATPAPSRSLARSLARSSARSPTHTPSEQPSR